MEPYDPELRSHNEETLADWQKGNHYWDDWDTWDEEFDRKELFKKLFGFEEGYFESDRRLVRLSSS